MEKEIIIRINHAKVNFTFVEEQIAEYFLEENPSLPINDLAKKLNVSPSSISRFCRKIGLSNYKELIYLYNKHLKKQKKHALNNIAIELQEGYFKIFDDIDKSFDEEKIEKICEKIHSTRLIHIFAFGLSATAALDFKFRFSRMGKFVEVIHDKSAIEMATSILEKGDLVFIFTLRGNKALEKVGEELKNKDVTVITITGNRESTLNKNSDIVINTANLHGEESTGIMSAQIPILVQIDLIYYYYIKNYKEVFDSWISTEKVFNKE
ncbi:MurR/RpiR family transcriptional regulator [Clostridium sp.]|uniref:MurR/RpiR family transcriptional regulator n=1 Tax=Clostridium sp. TaxID=1506 RepID=UPI00346463B1